ncbi:hypothetical protein CHH83_22290 [Bacillus sp. 7586-K]|uniref:Pimeloyl-ACP methyl ester carboxylesterase n=1 Tax=Metabacillus niabensis TaxID=324854 RepID=A0ABT9YZ58_9BACI|nr:alpha/beta hydrolase [Metabacillus niabensis]MDQ0225279.1 pimeloyl-ACP methyl ester carboxylesterase [Metabacillus niabensis]PAD66799.1 hypothetical protein CHH83_22290 [Bacillus sp. 7586-K]
MTNFAYIDGKKIAYDDIGSGIPIVFIHPPGMGRYVFHYQYRLQKKFRVIFPDLSGHGDSDRLHEHENLIVEYGNEIISLLDTLHISTAVICGYSAGGTIAQYLATHFQDRVKGLILFGGYPVVYNTLLAIEHKLGFYMAENHPNLYATILAKSHTKNKTVRKLLIKHMKKSQKEIWARYYEEVLHTNFYDEVDKLTMPILLIYGTRSDVFNRYNRIFRKKNKRIRIVFFKRTNHQTLTKRWTLANEEITRFCNRIMIKK